MSSRCDYCSGFGCIGECHDLPLPGALIACATPATVTAKEVHPAIAELVAVMAAESGEAGRPDWHIAYSGPAFWGYGRPGAAVWPEGVGQWGWRVYESENVIETVEGVAGTAWAAMLAAEDRLNQRSTEEKA